MTRPEIIWWAGDTASQCEIERALAAGLDRATQLHQSAHRTVYHIDPIDRIAPADSRSLVLKIHHTGTGRHAFRESLKRRIGRSPARREWRALELLHEKGVPVPRPRGWGRLPSGDEVVVSNFLDGERLGDRFRDAMPEVRRQLVNALARTIQKLHRSDYRHGDLHLGNLWVRGDEVYLLDLESARRRRHSRERLLDLAQLEFSLSRAGWDSNALASLRDQFGADERFAAVLRHFLRDHLRGGSGRATNLRATTQLQFDAVDDRSQGDFLERKSVAEANVASGTGNHRITDLNASGMDHISLFAVRVNHKGNTSTPVRIVLNRRNLAGDPQLGSLEIDQPIAPFVPTTAVTDGELPHVVPTTRFGQRSQQ
jgi:tRNA A-37 threonylcarbamoyl transferase component Bud32